MEASTSPAQVIVPPLLAPPTVPVQMPVVWRSGRLLITCRQVRLNDHCIKCNAFVGEKRIQHRFYWHHPVIILTVFAGLLVYLILALVLRKSVIMQLGLCPRHRRRRWMHIAITWVTVLAGIGLVIASAAAQSLGVFFLGLAVFFSGLVYAVITVPVLKPKQIDDSWGWFRGCGAEYLAAYPEWPYRR